MPSTLRTWVVAGVGFALLLFAVVVSCGVGTTWIPPGDVARVLLSRDGSVESLVVWELRFPRALVGVFVGVNLGLAGVLLQGVMRNPLASPEVVGVTSGAGLGAAIIIAFFPALGAWLSFWAFVGATAAGFSVYALSWRPGVGTSPTAMILAGVAVAATLGGVTTGVVVLSDQAQSIVGWMAGTLTLASVRDAGVLSVYAGGGMVLLLVLASRLDILGLGDDTARSVGMVPERTRFLAIVGACALAGSAISVAGLIGFVGLIVPHIAGLLVGPRTAGKGLVAAIGGGLLIVVADTAARLPSPQLPVGVVTAVLGGPYFLLLLYRSRILR